ncbi:MAG: GerW family sporulation protein [Lachnospiraceae bacterium]|nr:GerW family sporulation protein [Lachnospiraceae bacterium]
MAESFQNTVASLFKGMDNFLTTNTVVGDPVTVGDTSILPLVDVTFGVAASAKSEDRKNSGGGGMGGKISPSAVLVIQNGTTKLVNVRNQDAVTKILDMVPDFVNKFADGLGGKTQKDPDVDEAIHNASSGETTF